MKNAEDFTKKNCEKRPSDWTKENYNSSALSRDEDPVGTVDF